MACFIEHEICYCNVNTTTVYNSKIYLEEKNYLSKQLICLNEDIVWTLDIHKICRVKRSSLSTHYWY